MSGAELALAIIATVDLCYKDGKSLVELCERLLHAKSDIAERATRIRAIWLRTTSQLACIRRLAPILDEEHRDIQEETLRLLTNNLEATDAKLRSFLRQTDNNSSPDRGGQVRSTKYAVFGKSLDKAIDELEKWRDIFDPSWYLIMKAAASQIDVELAASMSPSSRSSISRAQSLRVALRDDPQVAVPVFLPPDGLTSIQISTIPHSAAVLGRRGNADRNVILDHIAHSNHASFRTLKNDVRTLARKLIHADPLTFGLLQCKGAVEHQQTETQLNAFTLVFKVPRDFLEPRSFRSWLLDSHATHSLSDRFDMATQLAKSVGYVHNFGFVHKNILPETILIFQGSRSAVGPVSLVGFGSFRGAEAGTLRSGDRLWEKNIYRHPRRQGQNPRDDYIMQHDIYSLGVCLLELGLRESFISYTTDENLPVPCVALEFANDSVESQDPFLTKARLLALTRDRLPEHMGTRYTDIVEACLTCLDKDSNGFGDEHDLLDEDGILVGVRFIEKVLLQLNSICV